AVEAIEDPAPILVVWLNEARAYWRSQVRAEVTNRQAGVERREAFWSTIDTALPGLGPVQERILVNIAPLIWKLVASDGRASLSPREIVRAGIFTEESLERLIDPDAKMRDPAWVAPHLTNVASLLYPAFDKR